MSREDDECAYVYASVPQAACDIQRWRHDDIQDHAFVEPTRAEAPQGEAPRDCHISPSCAGLVGHGPNAVCAGAAQPETGDDGRVRAAPWPRPACSISLPCGGCFTRGICDQVMWESGFAAGRAAENEACEKLIRRRRCEHARNQNCDCITCFAFKVLADAIAARRGSGT